MTYEKHAINYHNWASGNSAIGSYRGTWVNLSPKFDQMNMFCSLDLPPGCEHQEFYKGTDGKRYYVYHPYPRTKKWDAISILGWAEHKGISFEILSPDKSWHCPGKTFTIVMTLGDEKKFVDYVKAHRKKDEKWGGEWVVW